MEYLTVMGLLFLHFDLVLVVVLFGSWVHFDVDILQTVPGVCRITFLKVLDKCRPSQHFLFCQFLWKKRIIQRPTRSVLVWCNMIIFSSGSLVSLKPLVTLLDFFTKTQQSPQSDELQIIECLHKCYCYCTPSRNFPFELPVKQLNIESDLKVWRPI